MLRFHRRQPGDQHQAQLAIAALQRHGLPFFQHPDIKADIAPTGALRRNMLDLSLFRDLASNDMALSFAD